MRMNNFEEIKLKKGFELNYFTAHCTSTDGYQWFYLQFTNLQILKM